MEKPLVNNTYLLEKFPGKGGWTYAALPEIPPDKKAHFGWVRVKGRIDDYEIRNYHLMPMGNGQLFLPVKAEIRRKIRKQEGDTVHVVLFADNAPTEIPEELMQCLEMDAQALKLFMDQHEGKKKAMIEWIFAAKSDDTKVDRIARAINQLTGIEKKSDEYR